jgi:hypothetical protein
MICKFRSQTKWLIVDQDRQRATSVRRQGPAQEILMPELLDLTLGLLPYQEVQ